MNDRLIQEMIESGFEGPPVEMECDDCGTHMVVDPKKLQRFMNRSRFRCHDCGQMTRTVFLSGMFVNHNSQFEGVCLLCDGIRTGEFDL